MAYKSVDACGVYSFGYLHNALLEYDLKSLITTDSGITRLTLQECYQFCIDIGCDGYAYNRDVCYPIYHVQDCSLSNIRFMPCHADNPNDRCDPQIDTARPSIYPTLHPVHNTKSPSTSHPTLHPTYNTQAPSTSYPSHVPTRHPHTSVPTHTPSKHPSFTVPTTQPNLLPTVYPASTSTIIPSQHPTVQYISSTLTRMNDWTTTHYLSSAPGSTTATIDMRNFTDTLTLIAQKTGAPTLPSVTSNVHVSPTTFTPDNSNSRTSTVLMAVAIIILFGIICVLIACYTHRKSKRIPLVLQDAITPLNEWSIDQTGVYNNRADIDHINATYGEMSGGPLYEEPMSVARIHTNPGYETTESQTICLYDLASQQPSEATYATINPPDDKNLETSNI